MYKYAYNNIDIYYKDNVPKLPYRNISLMTYTIRGRIKFTYFKQS